MKKLYLLLFLMFTVGFAFGQIVTCPGDTTVNADLDGTGDCATDIKLSVDTSGFGGITITAINWTSAAGDALADGDTLEAGDINFPVGTTLVTVTVDTFGGSPDPSCTFNVIVQDTASPIVSGPSSAAGTTDGPTVCSHKFPTGDLALSGYSDNCAVDSISYVVTGATSASAANAISVIVVDASDVTFNTGVSTVTYTVKDVNGNIATHAFNVTVTDDDAPVNGQICGDYLDVYLDSGGSVWIDTVHTKTVKDSVEDNCTVDDDLTIEFGTTAVIFGCSDITATGVYHQVLLTVTDTANNDAQCYINVSVHDTLAPTMDCIDPDTIYMDSMGTVSIVAADIDDGTMDNCAVDSMWLNMYGFTCKDTGVFDVWLYADDASDNVDSCMVQVTVLDTIKPMIYCSNDTVYLDSTGMATVTVAGVLNSTWENTCSPIMDIDTVLSDTFFYCGMINKDSVITVTLTDGSGNQGTCTPTITVLDTLKPLVFCGPKDTVYLDSTGMATVVVGDIVDSVWDNTDCLPLADSILSDTFFMCDLVNTDTVISVKVKDVGGLESEVGCTTTIRVLDTIDPIVYCQTHDTIFIDSFGTAEVLLSGIVDSVWDNDKCLPLVDTILSDTFFSCSQVNTDTVITVTVEDKAGLTNTCNVTMTVYDTLSPEVVVKDTTVYLDSSGYAVLTTADLVVSTWENCLPLDDTTHTHKDTFSCDDLEVTVGIIKDTITVFDHVDSTGVDIAQITVMDSIHPIMVCIDASLALEVELDATTGLVTIDSNALDVGTWDNCTIDSMWMSKTDFNCNDVLLTDQMVTMYARDNSGNKSSCTRKITVNDVTPPVAICKDTTVYLDAGGSVTIDTSFVNNGSYDNSDPLCPITLEIDTATFGCASILTGGPVNVTLTATDVAGHTHSDVCQVTVKDMVNPEVTCIPKDTFYLDVSGSLTLTGADLVKTASDNCTIKDTTLSKTSFGCGDVGLNYDTVIVRDMSLNADTCVAEVFIMDTIPPALTCQDDTVYLNNAGSAFLDKANVVTGVSDACGVSDTTVSKDTYSCHDLGTNNVLVTVTDKNTNSNTCTAIVTVLDTVDPYVSCNDTVVYLTGSTQGSGSASITWAMVTDSVWDNDTCSALTYMLGQSSFACADTGKNVIEVTVKDASGNSFTCQSTVTVEDKQPPVIVCNEMDVVLWENGEYVLTGDEREALVAGSWDNCTTLDSADFIFDNFSFECVNVFTTQAVVTASVSDAAGNDTTAYCTVGVFDETPPVAVCRDTLGVVLDETGNALIFQGDINDAGDRESTPEWARTYNDLEGGSYDACGISDMSISQQAFSCADIGFNDVTLTVWDPSSNMDQCVTVVEVIDDIPPVLDPVADIGVQVGPGNCTTTLATYPVINATDACEVTYTQIAGLGAAGAFPLGATTETWVATDAGGNTDTVSFTVTVTTYNDAPVIDAIADVAVDEDPALVVVPLSGIGPGVDCDAQMVTSVAAVSDNAALITGIAVGYVAGEASGSLQLTVAPGMSGSATITVTVMDDGGTANGGVDTTVETFEVTVNPVNDAPELVNPLPDVTVNAGKELEVAISPVLGEVFDDEDGDALTLEVTLEDGSVLPGWGVYSGGVLTITPFRADTGVYNIKVVAADPSGAEATDMFRLDILDWPTGYENFENLVGVNMFPNPAEGMVTLEISGNKDADVEVAVMDITGKEVLRQSYLTTAGAIQFDMGSHVSGMYFVKLNVDGNEVVKKLVIDRK